MFYREQVQFEHTGFEKFKYRMKISFGLLLIFMMPFLNVSNGCDNGWIEYGNYCYIFQNKTSHGKTWRDASLSCQVMGANILSIEDQTENFFIKNILKNDSMQKESYWIGLNDACNNREFKWSDNTNPQFLNWLPKRPNNAERGENCVETNDIGWNDNDCDVKNGFICKSVKVNNGSCADGWANYKNYCYFFQNKNATFSGSDWESSYLSCRLKGGNLLSVGDQEENLFVTSIIKGIKENDSAIDQNFWISLNYLMSHKRYVWSDNTYWNQKLLSGSINQTNNFSMATVKCAVINVDGWSFQSCRNNNSYICKVKRNSNNTCAKDWLEFASYCYFFQSTDEAFHHIWSISFLKCLEKGGNLLSVNDEAENSLILNILKSYNMSKDNYWIGLTDRWYNKWYTWSDNTYLQYANPSFYLLFYDENFHCVRISYIYWEVNDCDSPTGFICKVRKTSAELCAENWIEYRRYCYFIQDITKVTWLKSFSICQSQGGNLLSIEDKDEDLFIQNLIKDTYESYWIGLNKLWNYKNFVWSDNTFSQFFNWVPKPSTNSDNADCVQINSNGWVKKECNNLDGYICKVKQVNLDYFNQREEIILTRGLLLGKLTVLKKEYTISFNLKPMSFSKGLKNVLQLISDSKSQKYKEKSLGVWFHEDGSGRLVIYAAVCGNSNHSVKTDRLTLGQWSNIKIYQWLFSNKYWFAIDINGVNIHQVENSVADDFKEQEVYASNLWNDAQNGSISDFLIINGKAKYVIESYNTPLVQGKIIAQIPRLNKEYLLSFDLNPMVFEVGLHSIIQFTHETNMLKNENEILGIWLDENGKGKIKVAALISGKLSFYYYPIKLNMWSNVEVSQSFNSLAYIYKIRINGDVVFTMINNQAQFFFNVRIYASNPWDKVQNGSIKNFVIINGISSNEIESVIVLPKDYVNHKHEFNLNRGTILGTLSVLKKEYTISFNLKPMSYSKGLKNVLHLACSNCKIHNDLNLGLWFHEDGSGSLVIYAAINGNSNYSVKTNPLRLGQWHNIRICQWLLDKKYFFTVDLNNVNIHRVENSLAVDLKNVKVYGSNAWDPPHHGSISDLLIINGKVEYIVGNIITPLVKAKLIAEIPVLCEQYVVSLDFNPIKFDFGSRNIIHFTIGSDHSNYGDKTPGIWSNAQGNGVLDIASSINGYVDVHTFSTDAFKLNQWSNIVISQIFNGSIYVYTISINEKVVFSIINYQAKRFFKVKVYASNPWTEVQNGFIKNLFVINGNSTEVMEPIVIASRVSSSSHPTSQKALILSVAILAPVSVIFVAVTFIAVSRFCRRKSQQSITDLDPYTIENYAECDEVLPDEWEILPEDIIWDRKIGEGAFGTVFIAKLSSSVLSKKHMKQKFRINFDIKESILNVAVKLVKDSADPSELNDFTEEMNLMKGIGYHKNIINLIGCSTIKKPLCLVVEYMEHGDLLNFLRKNRNNVTTTDNFSLGVMPHKVQLEENDVITADDLLCFAWQVASGMEYLSCAKLVHRDLAARNILVGAGKVVKISDFGLTRKTNDELNYMSKKKRRLPVKWMSVEAIFDQMFTSFSDVWAYGIVLFEIVTLGSTPYPAISNRELILLLKSGYRMDKPDNCSEALYDIMLQCWNEDPLQRPTFTSLREYFDGAMSQGDCYLDFKTDENTAPLYLAFEKDDNDDNIDEDRIFQNPKYIKTVQGIKKECDKFILPSDDRYTSCI
ncbi:uncharacterized protein LOC136085753 isoform X1 [Hydra vulgaris]|uniref:Uncharacterized protein LOC136085753 isoform X1 n=1 Tax=Hydra vulgaris TaxID=6087 RepID=A0ABM4CN28_HYDVU